MKKETVRQIKKLLNPLGYTIYSQYDGGLHLYAQAGDSVQIEFVSGSFMIKFDHRYFAECEMDELKNEIERVRKIVQNLNELISESGEKKESLLVWQKKIEETGLNVNSAIKFWTIVKEYGLKSGRNGSPEFTACWLENENEYTVFVTIDEEEKTIDIIGGIYEEDGKLKEKPSLEK